MKTRRIGVILLLVSAFFMATVGSAPGQELPIDKEVRLAMDYVNGKVPYTGPPVTYTGPPITLRFSTYVTKAYKPLANYIGLIFKRLEEESNGKLIIKAYWGGTLHGPRDGFKALREDITDYTHAHSIHHPGSFQLLHGMSLPFLFPDAPVAGMVAEELYPKYLKKEYEKMGVYMGGYMMTSTVNIVSKKPIRRLEDLKGQKVGVPGAGILPKIISSLGAVPTPMRPPELYTAFQRGVFEIFMSHDHSSCTFRMYEIAKYRTVVGLCVAPLEFALSRKTFDELPSDLKVVLYNWFRKHAQFAAQVHSVREGDRCCMKMEEKGIETIVLSDEELEKWRKAAAPVVEKFIADNEAKGLPAKAFVQDMRALSKKYSSVSWDELMQSTIDHPIQGIIDF